MVEIIIIIILCLITNIIKNLTSTNKIRTNIKPRDQFIIKGVNMIYVFIIFISFALFVEFTRKRWGVDYGYR